MFEVAHYLTSEKRNPVEEWLRDLADRQARARIAVRINRLQSGHFGDCKALSSGVWELRIDWGPGYRLYYARAGVRLILLLCGGDKRRQRADIERAVAYWKDWQRRQT